MLEDQVLIRSSEVISAGVVQADLVLKGPAGICPDCILTEQFVPMLEGQISMSLFELVSVGVVH